MPAKGYVARRLVYGKEIFDVVEQVKPDVIFVHCVETLTAVRFLCSRKLRKRYPMVFDSHMLSMATANRFAKVYAWFYKHFITPIICREQYEVIRTQDDLYVNTTLGIPESQTPFISFGTDTLLFYPSEEVRRSFRQEWDIPDDAFTVVYTGKLNSTKNGLLLARVFKKKFEIPSVLICVGSPPNTEYGKAVSRLLKASENRVIMFPTQKYTELAKFYQAADLSVFPKQCSMSFYDAQACGLPVLSEDNNINRDRCGHGNGMNFEADNLQDFRHKLEIMMQMPKEQYDDMRRNAQAFIDEGYSYRDIATQYTQCLENAITVYKAKHKKERINND